MESGSVPLPHGSAVPAGSAPGEKGLKTGAIGFVSSLVIGVASTAPGYSLAASLGFVVAVGGIGVLAPAIFIVSFVPMLLIAAAYYYMNRADPDCGTTFSWVTRAMGPQMGWVAGWAIVVADIIVMANLAQIAGLYSFILVGIDAPSTLAVTIVGVIWIAVMTAICVIGIELSARTQVGLLSAEIVTLLVFAAVALIKVWTGNGGPDSIDPSWSWLNPLEIPLGNANPFSPAAGPLVGGVLIAVFIYWGWDSTVTVNEESQDSTEGPGQGRDPRDDHPAVHLRDRVDRGRGLCRTAGADRQRRRGAERDRYRRVRIAARQDLDHRGADVGRGIHPDHDPADGANDALDGASESDAEVPGRGAPALPDAGRSRRS